MAQRWRFVDEESEPFAPPFGDVVKAAFVYQNRINATTPETLTNWLVSIRALYEVIRRGNDDLLFGFSWGDLTLRDWHSAEDYGVDGISASTQYKIAGCLQNFAALLKSRGLIPRTLYKHRQKRPRHSSILHIEDKDAAMKKLPPTGALHALADAAQNPEDDQDRLLFAIVKLLVALGFRINEALTLPVDCWRVNEEGRSYLIYWPEKGGPLLPKWIPTPTVELVQDAVETLWELTEEARQRARVLEADPTRVPLPGGHRSSDLLGTAELSKEFRMDRSNVRKFLNRLGISPHTKSGGTSGKAWLWKVDDLERSLVKDLPDHRYEMDLLTGGRQRLSESLCIMPKIPHNGSPSLLTVRSVTAARVENFLVSGKPHEGSVFERYGLFDENDKPWSISTHQFRHWLNTVAHKGGLSDMELARWMGRRDVRQNRQYQHLNAEERIERVKEGVRNGEMFGPISEVYNRLPEGEREQFLDAAVEAAHVTPYGSCTHNFATKPCEYYVQCVTGCESYLRTKGDQREVVYLEQEKRQADHNIEAAENADQEEWSEAANWIESERRRRDGIERALAIEDDQHTADGERVQVFPESPNLGDTGGEKR